MIDLRYAAIVNESGCQTSVRPLGPSSSHPHRLSTSSTSSREARMASETNISPERQLNLEIFVSELKRSLAFWQSIGFTLVRSDEHFALLRTVIT
ncbi:hypothetical protein JAAARDRAFT_72638 [Jaapia argillacea MUCL 33604]|uniref:Uncharacterized protein n=1 Tax=Jaapia argillacea MUCL 33604 TaxID=933084 RepID=A0A067PFB7_9AGAM|nr:hypothetical protein JAAARDRAFT_72638 [Jaapia argillacea MUCL 33604]